MSQPNTAQDKAADIMSDLVDLHNKINLYSNHLRNPDEDTIEYCGKLFVQMKEIEEAASELDKLTGALSRLYKEFIMPKRMKELGEDVTKFTVKGVGTFALQDDFHISIIAAKKEEGKVWLTENGLGDLIQETVNASSLKAAIKKYIKANEEFPDEEIFRIYPVEFVKVTKKG